MNSKQIDQLRARISELEFVVSRKDEAIAERTERIAELEAAHAAAVLSNVQSREALDVVSIAPLVNDCGLPKYGVSVSEMKLVQKALALPRDTSALDAYVAEKVKAARSIDEKQIAYLFEERLTLTRQRDLAVNALEAIAGKRVFIDNLASNVDIAVMTLAALKESEVK